MNRIVELHDSELEAIVTRGSDTTLVFKHAYVHQSEGKPGIDAGTGWSHRASLFISMSSMIPHIRFPFEISDGYLTIDGIMHSNILPIPLKSISAIELFIRGIDADGFHEFSIAGNGARLEIEEPGKFVEESPGAKI